MYAHCVYKQILILQNYRLEREVKKQNWMGEVHWGGEGPLWTVVQSKKRWRRRRRRRRRSRRRRKSRRCPFVPARFNIKKFYVLPTHCMCFLWISERTAIISLYSINWLVFITETESVYCAVRTGSVNILEVNLFSFLVRTVHIRLEVNEAALGQVFLPVLWCTIPPMLHTHQTDKRAKPVNLPKGYTLSELG
jgi:hypothetical protein